MFTLNPSQNILQFSTFSHQFHCYPPYLAVAISNHTRFLGSKCLRTTSRSTRKQRVKKEAHSDNFEDNIYDEEIEEEDYNGLSRKIMSEGRGEDKDYDRGPEFADIIGSSLNDNGFSRKSMPEGRGEDKDYDRDPEFADIIGSSLDDPDKARSKVEERLRKKRNKILHTKTGSPTPMEVKFSKFDFSNSYIWIEFYNSPLEKDVALVSDTIRSWHIVGRLGGCNSLNMQLSQSPFDKRPSYDAIQGANVNPTTFYNIGDLEIQDNLARIWVDIGTREALLLDVLVNALTQISSDYVGIKQVVFGGSEFDNWRENLTSDDPGYAVHKI